MVRVGIVAFLLALLMPAMALANEDDSALEPGFRGKIAYFGSYTGATTILANGRYVRPRDCPYKDRRCDKVTVGGGIKVVLEFDEEYVTGFYYTIDGFEGPNGLQSGNLVGRRTANGCSLFQSDGTKWEGMCNRRQFQGLIDSVPGVPKQAEITYDLSGMSVFDIGVIEEAQAAAAAYKQRVEWLEGIANNPGAGPGTVVPAVVELDLLNSYPDGIERLTIEGLPAKWPGSGWLGGGRARTYNGSFATSSGDRRYVTVGISGGRVSCVWIGGGSQNGCPAPRPAPPPPVVPDEQPDDKGWFSFSSAPVVPSRK